MEFKKPIYPIEQWNITETEFKKENNYRNETTFALSNGYIGTRGTFEEAYPFDVDTGLEGNFVNGFYESNEIRYGEANFGSPLLSQSLLNLPNLKEIHVILDGEEFTMEQGEVKEYARTLHMKDGILERKLTWTASSGKMTEIHISRLVSFARKISWRSVIRSDQSIMLERWSLCPKCRQMWKIIQEKPIRLWTMDHLDGDLILIM